MRQLRALLVVTTLLPLGKCPMRTTSPRDAAPVSIAGSAAAPALHGNQVGPIRMEALDPAASPPMFVMRGGPRGAERLVFLHGLCGHGLGYAQAFQFSAAKKGSLVAPQGDISCGGPFSKWSSNVPALDARVVETFQRLVEPDNAAEITIMGMSQGADRAVALAARYPAR